MSVDEAGCKEAQDIAGHHQRLYNHRRTGRFQNRGQKVRFGVVLPPFGMKCPTEEMGYLEQPHTSAGRVPSDKGYRLYVDKLMKVRV